VLPFEYHQSLIFFLVVAKKSGVSAQCHQVIATILFYLQSFCLKEELFHFDGLGFFHSVSLLSIAVSRYELRPLDEMLVLCSDGVIENRYFRGVSANVVEKARESVLVYGFEAAAEELCNIAIENSCDDNVTAVLVRFCEVKPFPAPPRRFKIGATDAFKKL
jgi:serine/threonine protein phosphatase PrpC